MLINTTYGVQTSNSPITTARNAPEAQPLPPIKLLEALDFGF